MNTLKIFENEEFGKVRTIIKDNEPWFVGKDIAEILGYKDINRAVKQHVDKYDLKICDYKGYGDLYPTLWNNNSDFANKVVINESGLYSLIFASELPKAKKFKRWVTSEVLPSIRKTGSYNAKPSITFEQTLEMAKVIKDTPIKAMQHVFRALKVFVPELEMPDEELSGSKVVRNKTEFQKQLNRYLKDNNLSICSFARKTGLSKSNVSNWVNGKVTPSLPNLKIIGEVTDLDINIFL